ncbi:nuclease-related domain-containing protein [Paenibacillus alkalitolerans]|uniref:nuclease-related domain-containing protein n=1 Tax=Paenibacillus alkalitolerans TaxID=2799335 RepID=UPI002D7F210F|nr:nuclease-related domain-containing protein [Paenibacillus alkalitolerans]
MRGRRRESRRQREEGIRRAGEQGERETAHQLGFLGKDHVIFHGVKLRAGGRVQEFDHIAVGPKGVFHFESKHWSGEIAFEAGGMLRDGAPSKDPTSQLYRHEYVLKELVRSVGVETDVTGVLVFTHPDVRLLGKSPAFATVRADRLLHYMNAFRSKRPLDARNVQRIAAAIREHTVK